MLTSQALRIASKLVFLIEQRFKEAEKALSYCDSCDEQFLNSVIELETDLKSARKKHNMLFHQNTKYTGISLDVLQNKYL